MSIATIYNCLKNLEIVVLLNKLNLQKNTAIFDTNINQHHHFLDEETGELIDIENDEVNLRKLPKIPQGYLNNGVEVLIKLRTNLIFLL